MTKIDIEMNLEEEEKIKVGITHGDINGIGYEIIIKSFLDNRITELCNPIVYGSSKLLAYHRKVLNIETFSLRNAQRADEPNTQKGCIINCVDDNTKVELGKPTEMSGKASIDAIERATEDLIQQKIDVLVTAPIHKQNINDAGFQFPGHTEYFNQRFNPEADSLMLMVSDRMKVGVVTGHIPIRQVADALTYETIMSKLKVLNQSLIIDFGIRKPRIAMLGLNPHAGDKGVIGTEDTEIIAKVVEHAQSEGIMVLGPYPADGFFGSNGYTKFDAILAMYHDQGLIPFKALLYEGGVNYTAGMPFIRTSPAHGTAYEIAGQGKASEKSMRDAIYLACDIFKNRKMYEELNKNAMDTSQTHIQREGAIV